MRKKQQAETDEQTKLHRENDRFEKKRKQEAETEEEKRKREAETEEETKRHRENMRLRMKKNRRDETEEQKEILEGNNRLAKKRKRGAETEKQTNVQRENNKLAMRRKRQAGNCHSKTEEHKDDMEDVINLSKKEAMKFLHRAKDLKNPHKHRAIVCIICDHCIIGTEAIHKLTKEQILFHKKRLSVDSYEEYYETTLNQR